MGKRGPKPGSGGRPPKAIAEKIIEGNPGKRELNVVSFPTSEESVMPKPRKYLSEKQNFAKLKLEAKQIYTETWEWLKERGCEQLVSKTVIERYAIAAARAIQCEQCISSEGFLAEHPTTHAEIASPFVTISEKYTKQANNMWGMIYQIVKENCLSPLNAGGGSNEDPMEKLLKRKGG